MSALDENRELEFSTEFDHLGTTKDIKVNIKVNGQRYKNVKKIYICKFVRHVI